MVKKLVDLYRKFTGAHPPPVITTAPPVQHKPEHRPPPRRDHDHREKRPPRGDRPARPPHMPRAKPESVPQLHRSEQVWDPAEFNVPPEPGKVRFHDLDLPAEVMHAIHDLGFRYCTPIQAGILAHTLSGRDATGRAQTGTGKTAAFVITILKIGRASCRERVYVLV